VKLTWLKERKNFRTGTPLNLGRRPESLTGSLSPIERVEAALYAALAG